MSSLDVTLSSGALRVLTAGSGRTLLFVHGFPLDGRMWSRQATTFAATHRVLVPDLRGFGGSSAVSNDETLTMDRLADDLAELLERLEIADPVTLVGLSMGGYIAWEFFRRHRTRLAGLVLCDTRAATDAPEARENRFKVAQMVLERGMSPLAESMGTKLFGPDVAPDVRRRVQDMLEQASPAGTAAASRGMAERADATGWLSSIDVPTLVVCGEFDAISPPAEMRAIADGIPNARYERIPSAGHMSPMENGAVFDRVLGEFLASHDL